MAIDRNTRYPGRFDAPTTARPQGAFKNRSAPGAKDGSYLERDWANDWDGFFGSLLRSAGLTPNGTPDTALASQYFDAIVSLGLRQATESVTGVSKFSTLPLALAGLDDSTSMTPLKVRSSIQALSLGGGQSRQNVLASRVLGTAYTNSTGRPIEVVVTIFGGTGSETATVNVNGFVIYTGDPGYGTTAMFSFIVLNGESYMVDVNPKSGANLVAWTEVR